MCGPRKQGGARALRRNRKQSCRSGKRWGQRCSEHSIETLSFPNAPLGGHQRSQTRDRKRAPRSEAHLRHRTRSRSIQRTTSGDHPLRQGERADRRAREARGPGFRKTVWGEKKAFRHGGRAAGVKSRSQEGQRPQLSAAHWRSALSYRNLKAHEEEPEPRRPQAKMPKGIIPSFVILVRRHVPTMAEACG